MIVASLDRTRGGVLLVDKPRGPTSHDVVRQVRRLLQERSVGHCGTLDPLASGLLVLVVGQSTRLASHASDEDKVYHCTCQLGLTTDSDDVDGEVLERHDASAVRDDAIEAALGSLRGLIQQVPPSYSAVHVDGERAHARSRRGEKVQLAAREIQVHRLVCVARRDDEVELEIAVSKGGYVRSLVRDLGQILGCGATVSALRRLRAGHLDVADACTLDSLDATSTWNQVLPPQRLFSPERCLTVDTVTAALLEKHATAPWTGPGPRGASPWFAMTVNDVVGVVEASAGELRLRRGFPARDH
ncbi:MAG: tRNA pseudouridine(55) synthase TruB [Pseudomonadota bacterium]